MQKSFRFHPGSIFHEKRGLLTLSQFVIQIQNASCIATFSKFLYNVLCSSFFFYLFTNISPQKSCEALSFTSEATFTNSSIKLDT